MSHGHREDDEPHEPLGDLDGDAAADEESESIIWANDNVILTTVGIDVGSATSHLMFSRIHLQRPANQLSSRFVVVERRALYRSPIALTPYLPTGLIDVGALRAFVDRCYDEAGIARSSVDTGAVILTGVALERANARGIAEMFASEGGKFVCASAGHNLEALLAAHGSGAVARSRDLGSVLNIDIGGGTTKYALAVDGKVVATLAIRAGARLVEFDGAGMVTRIEHDAAVLARELRVPLRLGAGLDRAGRARLADGLATRIIEAAFGRVRQAERLAGDLPRTQPGAVILSGGVGELVVAQPAASFGDLGIELASALRARAAELPAPLAPAAERIRATVIGASQFSVQLSGNTVLTSSVTLPLHNVPVVAIAFEAGDDEGAVAARIAQAAERLDLAASTSPLAVAVAWDGEPFYATVRALASGIARAHLAAPRRDAPVIVALTADVGRSVGMILTEELEIESEVIAIDGIELADLDFIDIGQCIRPANVVPVVVKSLVFPAPADVQQPEILIAP